ncbi:MAG: nucleotidyltransferase family protein, partial [Vulcanimicrobiaceae bacterium]
YQEVNPNMRPTYVILAAGSSTRMGFDKAIEPLAGRSPLERVVLALGDRDVIVVVPTRLAAAAVRIAPNAQIVCNDEAERGMVHSLRLALTLVARDRCFGVLPADMAAMTEATIARTESTLRNGIDVAYPVRTDGVGGHPVLFASTMRRLVEELPEGDTLRRARDAAPERATWLCIDSSAFLDLDHPADWRAFTDM